MKQNQKNINHLLIILGPTATGKTDIALNLAKKFEGELVAADSRQVYKGLDIGTGKLPNDYQTLEKHEDFWLVDGVKIWMYDVIDFTSNYNVKDYIEQTSKVIEDIKKRGKLPILVGGTGFYIEGLLKGIPNLNVPINLELRQSLQNLGVEELQKKLKALSPTRLEQMNSSDRNNPRRLQRAIELEYTYPYIGKENELSDLQSRYEVLKVGLTASLPFLKQKILNRLANRVSQGLINEVVGLQKKGLTIQRMKELGLEYGVLADFLIGKYSEEESLQVLGNKIYQFAKRQMTWFKRDKEIQWFDISQMGFETQLVSVVSEWYDT